MLLPTRAPAPVAPAGPESDAAGWVAPQCAPSTAASTAPIVMLGHRDTTGDYHFGTLKGFRTSRDGVGPPKPGLPRARRKWSRQKVHCSLPIRAVGFLHGCAGWNGADRRRNGR